MSGAPTSGWKLRWKKDRPDGPAALIDGSSIRPDLLASLPLADLRGVKIQAGQREATLAELFEIEALPADGGAARIVVEGSPRFVRLGAGMEAGTLEVEGNGGELLGAEMRGGVITVRGNAGRLIGSGLHGGLIRIEGDAGDLLGGPLPGETAGMRGGEIIVLGSAGSETGLCMRRGLIAVASSAGELVGHHLLAGTILVARGELTLPGVEMRRGTIIGLESRARPPLGFATAGPVHLEWLRILRSRLTSLAFPLAPAAAELISANRPLECWSGDGLSLGKGEILQPVA